ncbi:MAG: hypothetical protein ACKO96_33240, partial [Flammeovirgaceae bacterium]
MKTKMIISTACLVFSISAFGQQAPALQLPKPKRFIEKLEFVLGTGLCFNYGNMFIENYRGEFANGNFVTNTRLTKAAFSVGVGVYHPVNDRVDVNVRIMWEQKGYRSELNNPLLSDYRSFTESEYT